MNAFTGILIQETSRIVVAGLNTDQIRGPDVELRIATVYAALKRAAESGEMDIVKISTALEDEAQAEVARVLDRESRSPKVRNSTEQ